MKNSIITYRSPKDPISEAFRNMRTNITFANIDEDMRVLTVTSPGHSEGKTTIITNYAVALAQTGKQVLLMDGDLRRPRLHRMFGLHNNKGLTNVLLRESQLNDVIQKTEIENLHLVSSGPIPPNPSEIMASRSMALTINTLKSAYDFVLIDAPPLGVVTDAAVLSKVTDGYIVIAALSVTNRDNLRMVMENLKNVGGNIIGVVANNTPQTKRSGYYYYYYDYSYDQQSKRPESKEEIKQKKKMKKQHH